MVTEIEKITPFDVGALPTLKGNAWAAMNSYLHCGFRQVGRRVSAKQVRLDYDEEEILEVISVANWLVLLSFQHIATVLHRPDLAEQATERFESES